MGTTLLTVLVFFVIALGVLGSVIPLLPGPPLILLAAFVYALATHFEKVTGMILGILGLLTLLSLTLDQVAGSFGAKRFGGTRWGMLGAFVGGVTGFLWGGIIGIVIGPFVGAAVLEWVRGKDLKASSRIGLGTLVGFLGGAVGKLVISLIMTGLFIWSFLGNPA
jgi:uncharacterized protein YqgC (DUF456 family)